MSATKRLIVAPGVHVAAIELAILWLSLRGCNPGGRTQSGMALYRSGKVAGCVDFYRYNDTIRVDRWDAGCTGTPPVHCIYGVNTDEVFKLICQLLDRNSEMSCLCEWLLSVVLWAERREAEEGSLQGWTWTRLSPVLARLDAGGRPYWATVADLDEGQALVLVPESAGPADQATHDPGVLRSAHKGKHGLGVTVPLYCLVRPSLLMDAFAGILLQYGVKMEGGGQ